MFISRFTSEKEYMKSAGTILHSSFSCPDISRLRSSPGRTHNLRLPLLGQNPSSGDTAILCFLVHLISQICSYFVRFLSYSNLSPVRKVFRAKSLATTRALFTYRFLELGPSEATTTT